MRGSIGKLVFVDGLELDAWLDLSVFTDQYREKGDWWEGQAHLRDGSVWKQLDIGLVCSAVSNDGILPNVEGLEILRLAVERDHPSRSLLVTLELRSVAVPQPRGAWRAWRP